jgi:hypothetical protein
VPKPPLRTGPTYAAGPARIARAMSPSAIPRT